MNKNELVLFVKHQIQKLKKQKVADMMREGDSKKLLKVIHEIDISAFKNVKRPEFSFRELQVNDADGIMALCFYIWANLYVDGGDLYFFNKEGIIEFWDAIEEKCDTWGNSMSIVLREVRVLNQVDYDCYLGMTIEELLHPETIVSVNIKEFEEIDEDFGDDYFFEAED